MKIGISITPIYTLNGTPRNIHGIGTYTSQLYQALIDQNISVEKIYFKKTRDTFAHSSTKNFWVARNPLLSLAPGNFYNNLRNKINLLRFTDYSVPRIKAYTGCFNIYFRHPCSSFRF